MQPRSSLERIQDRGVFHDRPRKPSRFRVLRTRTSTRLLASLRHFGTAASHRATPSRFFRAAHFFLPRCFVRGAYEKIGGKEKRERRKVVLVSFSLSLFLSVVGEAQKRRMKREKREGVKILATLEAFSFDAHRIPGRLESLRFP